MSALSDSVGKNGANLKQDVLRVQKMLRSAGFDPGPDDGVCGSQTVAAIEAFQNDLLVHADGLIEANGPTWRRLAEIQRETVDEERRGGSLS